MLKLLFFTSLLISHSLAVSTPGASTQTYRDKERIHVYANELDSIKTQLNFEYYFLNFCRGDSLDHLNENLGTILRGETTQITPYQFVMNQNQVCSTLCKRDFSEEDVEKFGDMIEKNYRMNFILDNLPVLHHVKNGANVGLSLGYKLDRKGSRYNIFNHLTFRVEVDSFTNAFGEVQNRIVGFSAFPNSLGSQMQEGNPTGYCEAKQNSDTPNSYRKEAQELKPGPIYFSYDVEFIRREKTLESRFRSYLLLGSERIHQWSMINSSVVIIILICVIGTIFQRTLGKDTRAASDEPRTVERVREDAWKKLSRDVFRPPQNPLILSTLIGTGLQILSASVLALISICLGLIDHTRRGTVLIACILFYASMGFISGYFSARMYKMFQGSNWLKCAITTAIFYPVINLALLSITNHHLISKSSSQALLALLATWLGVSTPLVFLGSLAGYKRQAIQNPSKYNSVPTPIKPVFIWAHPIVLSILGGLLPFGSIFIELVFVMISVWKHSFYYFYSYLFGTFLILAATCALISIVITYVSLTLGNHKIWWLSFWTSGSIGVYIFAYSIFFYFIELQLTGFSSFLMYFGCMLALSFLLSILTGAIGFFASYWFTTKIYASLKESLIPSQIDEEAGETLEGVGKDVSYGV